MNAGSHSNKPIALLIPVWNRQEKLDRALESVMPESDLVQVVVIDDGSSPPIRVGERGPPDVHLIRLPANQGIARALNAGLDYAFARGFRYIARLDSDDSAENGRFAKQLDFMNAHPSVGICGSGYHECSTDGRIRATVVPPCGNIGIRRGMNLSTTLWHPTVMIRASVARTVGFYDPGFACEDLDYFQRILAVTEAANLPEALVRYEVGSADALTGAGVRRRRVARDILRLKWRSRRPLDPLWWLGLVSAGTYYLGLNRLFAPLRGAVGQWLARSPR